MGEGAAPPVGAEEAAGLLAPVPLQGGALLLAVSGGPDSTALLGLAARWAAERDVPLLAATVDHGLREGSRAEAEVVGRLCAALGVPHHLLAWEGEKPSTGLQEAARAARYRLLLDCARARGAGTLLTAHTRDDQAETVLMRLAHGSGLTGLAGMRPLRACGEILHARPLLGLPKARLVATCRSMGLPFVADPANLDPRHERARWRALGPALEAAGLTPARLATLARRAARAEEALDAAAAAAFARHVSFARDASFAHHAAAGPAGIGLGFRALLDEAPPEIALRVLAHGIAACAPAGPAPRLRRLEALFGALAAAARAGRPLRRTLRGCLLDLDAGGRLRVCREGPRRAAQGREPG